MKVTRIITQEDAPRYSTYDPYSETAFGTISFHISGKKFEADLVDRCADEIRIYIKDKPTRSYRLSMKERIEFNELTEKLWDKKEVDVYIPFWLTSLTRMEY